MVIQLSSRQYEILQLVQKQAPITGEQIAEQLGVSRPTIRSDLSILVMLGYLDAKPKVGYFPGKSVAAYNAPFKLDLKVKDVQLLPVIVRETATVNDAVVSLFLGNTGTLIVADADGILLGVISSKDLLKVTLGNPNAASMPVSIAMTRTPNIVTISPEDHIIDAAKKMVEHQIDTLPVVVSRSDEQKQDKWEVVGRVTKTTITKLILRLGADL